MLYRQRTIDLPRGELRTPTLFPVRNIGKRSSDNTPEYTDTIPDLPTAMINARAIRQRAPMWDRLTDGRPLREEMGVPEDTIVFADSGGYDFKATERDIDPAITLETQDRLDADIYGTVDLPITPENRFEENQRRIQQNIKLALETSDRHTGSGFLIASVHGHDPATIKNAISRLERDGEFDGYAVGSLVPVRTDYTKVTQIILAARTATDKHLHVYGLGGHVYQPLLLYLGVDSYDSSSFIRSSGNRRYLIPGFGGEELWNIDRLDYLPCSCPVCGTRTLDEVREDRNALTKHNLWAMTTELRRFRYIVESDQDVEDYLDLRFSGNAVTKRAYETAKLQVKGYKK
jgi:tRNA-guanine family transglycosylase